MTVTPEPTEVSPSALVLANADHGRSQRRDRWLSLLLSCVAFFVSYVLTAGPAVIARQDPLQLMRREVCHADAQTFWVHPRYVPLPPMPVGFAKVTEGLSMTCSPELRNA